MIRSFLMTALLLTAPTAAFAQVPPVAIGPALNALDSITREFTTPQTPQQPRPRAGRCPSGQHATLDMYGNMGCAPGAYSGRNRATRNNRLAQNACAMGSVKMGDGSCKRVPGARTAPPAGARTR